MEVGDCDVTSVPLPDTARALHKLRLYVNVIQGFFFCSIRGRPADPTSSAVFKAVITFELTSYISVIVRSRAYSSGFILKNIYFRAIRLTKSDLQVQGYYKWFIRF
jgi:hypothetical protein